jgi:CheY-like chemotaxis protein
VNVLAGTRILLVEDEALIAALAADMLQDLGVQVIGPAPSLAQALALARTEPLDAAVLDINLREERVDAVAALLRERGIPFVFATGYGRDGMAPDGQPPVVEKPYTQEKLAEALARALGRHR